MDRNSTTSTYKGARKLSSLPSFGLFQKYLEVQRQQAWRPCIAKQSTFFSKHFI